MKVSGKDVAYVAELANLDLTAQERDGMLRDLNSILDYIDLLDELDTSNVPPMAQVAALDQAEGESRGLADAGREDVPEGLRPSLPQDAALANAPGADGTFFRVPKVIER
jgi:aspartyl-tRNA(Asn)/glutamyl-tRNA(Gln) amidotransferase subunit C